MNTFRLTLMTLSVIWAAFTLFVFARDGADFLTPYMAALPGLGWPAHIHLDFALYLVLSGLWLAWRTGVAAGGRARGGGAPWVGMRFLAPYRGGFMARGARTPQALLLGVHART